MKFIKTTDAVGCMLCHDITRIVKGVVKEAVFRKGHIIREEDIPVMLSIGKDHIYAWENDDTKLHENDAAEILRQICQGNNIHATPVKEGKIELISDCDGLFTVAREGLTAVNSCAEMMIATRHSGFAVKRGDKLAGTRIIPLLIEKEKMEKAKQLAGDKPLLNVVPFKAKKVGLITTGNEVFHNRIEDTFTPLIKEKLACYGGTVTEHIILDDDHIKITQAIAEMLAKGVDMVICTGGMSVDPDDKTPLAIKNSGVNIVSYGAPVLPGAMFLLSYTADGRPVMGLPGCVMYEKRTIFDLVLPYIMADVTVTNQQLVQYGEGGLCLNCSSCTFPNCGFGK